MVFANLNFFSHNFVNFQVIWLKFSEEVAFSITLGISLPQFYIKCKQMHKLDIFFQEMALRYILMAINYRWSTNQHYWKVN